MPGDIIILHKCTKNHDHMLYCSWDMAHDRCNCYFSFRAIFCPFTPLTAQKIKMIKKKKGLEISSLYKRVLKIMVRWCLVPEIWCAKYGRTDRWKKWHIVVGAPPKNVLVITAWPTVVIPGPLLNLGGMMGAFFKAYFLKKGILFACTP